MADESQVRTALAAVEEPELRVSVTELGLVQGVAVDGDTAVIAIALPLPGDARHECAFFQHAERARVVAPPAAQ